MRFLFEKKNKIITLQMKLYITDEYMNNDIFLEKKIMKSFFNKAKLNHFQLIHNPNVTKSV